MSWTSSDLDSDFSHSFQFTVDFNLFGNCCINSRALFCCFSRLFEACNTFFFSAILTNLFSCVVVLILYLIGLFFLYFPKPVVDFNTVTEEQLA